MVLDGGPATGHRPSPRPGAVRPGAVRWGPARCGPDDGGRRLAVTNPPYAPAPGRRARRGRAAARHAGADGRALLDRICVDGPPLLRPGGVLLLAHSGLYGAERTVEQLARAGLRAGVNLTSRRPGPSSVPPVSGGATRGNGDPCTSNAHRTGHTEATAIPGRPRQQQGPVYDLCFLHGAGDGNQTHALSLGITGRSTRITSLTSSNDYWRQAVVPAAAAVIDRCSPLCLVRIWCGRPSRICPPCEARAS